MSQLTPTPADSLYAELRTLIASSRQRLSSAVNTELIRQYLSVGHCLAAEVLSGEWLARRGLLLEGSGDDE